MASCLAIPSKYLLSRLICLMNLQVTANFHVALMRVKIIWKLTHKTHDTVDNLRGEEQGPPAVTHAPTVLRKCRQIATRDVSPQGLSSTPGNLGK